MKVLDFSHLSSSDISYIDNLYEDYKQGRGDLDPSWKFFFQGFEFQLSHLSQKSGEPGEISEGWLRKEFNVFRLIQGFRTRGHLIADTNPIRPRKDRDARIGIEYYDLKDDDLDKTFLVGEFVGLGKTTLRNIIQHMTSIYCGHIGIEYTHSNNTDVRRWIRKRFEETAGQINYPLEKKKRILRKLNEATVFESFLQSKFVGQKRFSLEGGETTIPALDTLINKGAELGAKEFVIGMPHRGRLNVLANIIGKTYEYIFSEFQGGSMEEKNGQGDGDVKYHMGFTSIKEAAGGEEVYLKILPNPSHLEAVGPVLMGYNRSQIDVAYHGDEKKIVPICLHGDAAVAGQGVVYETLQMCKLPGYRVGGMIHFVINNQIGFTTDFVDGRSSHYCVSLAKAMDAPVFHVNGDDPEAVVYVCELAMEYRQKFHEDVFIDMVCYRKYGHNEGDEPKYTQPHLYGLIAKQKNPRELYLEKLINSKEITQEFAKNMQKEFKNLLSDRLNNVKQDELPTKRKGPHKEWLDLRFSEPEDFESSPQTGVKRETLDKIITSITSVPDGFKTLKKAQKILDERRKKYDDDAIDWAIAEMLAYGSLLCEGKHIRFSGQDVIRGTFSHRHAKVFDEMTNEAYCGLEHIQDEQGKIFIYNSLLSEYAVLGFEYGYSQGTPHGLNIWEAQFGDFVNGAQIILDQFISACESKWRRMTDLVMLLPHGYEGQGPEHSSGRMERFLQLAAEGNMIVMNPTLPANLFHALRRQQAWEFRKPLVVFTPKSMLRDPRCISSIEDFTSGAFREVLDDSYVDAEKVKRILFCTGKVYYDLLKRQQEDARKDIAIVRLEQLYPLVRSQIETIINKYKSASEICWVQEEPYNMGAATYLFRWRDLFRDIKFISRKSSASPATGFSNVHQREQKEIIDEAFK